MKYWTRSLLGLALCLASTLAVSYGLYHLVRTGTCASGGPYVSARPCPAGTGGKILALVGGIFGGLIGIAIYATRGSRREGSLGLGIVMWALLFVCLAVSAIVAAFGPAHPTHNPGAKTTAIIFGVLFIPMGLIPLIAATVFAGQRGRSSRSRSSPTPSVPDGFTRPMPHPTGVVAAATPSAAQATGDALDRLRKLGELRSAGVITDQEFEAKKAEILDEI